MDAAFTSLERHGSGIHVVGQAPVGAGRGAGAVSGSSPPGIAVRVVVENGRVLVGDPGPGIAPEDLPHIFERFYRAPGARGLPGAGLGLARIG